MTSRPENDAPARRMPAALRAMRPKQWVKNVLVLAAPLAAGRLFEPDVAWRTAVAVAAFVLASATVYLVNDVRDVEEDRLHPRKRHRPVAAGELSVRAALGLATACLLGACALSWWLSIALGATVLAYVVLQTCYSLLLKHQPVIDLAVVAAGFLLRAIAGGTASGIELSTWFLLVASFGSLFMVAGKRYSELVVLGAEAGTRRSLQEYSASYLRFVWATSVAVVITSYCLWAFEHRAEGPWGVPWTVLSIAPFTLALLRYAYEIDRGAAGEPEDVVMADRVLQVLGATLVALVAVAVLFH